MLILKEAGVLVDSNGTPLSEADILSLTGADRDEASEGLARWREVIPQMVREEALRNVPHAALDFVMSRPGALRKVDGSYICSDEYRDFVLSMMEPGGLGESLTVADMAEATHVPEELLQEWVRLRSVRGTS